MTSKMILEASSNFQNLLKTLEAFVGFQYVFDVAGHFENDFRSIYHFSKCVGKCSTLFKNSVNFWKVPSIPLML